MASFVVQFQRMSAWRDVIEADSFEEAQRKAEDKWADGKPDWRTFYDGNVSVSVISEERGSKRRGAFDIYEE